MTGFGELMMSDANLELLFHRYGKRQPNEIFQLDLEYSDVTVSIYKITVGAA